MYCLLLPGDTGHRTLGIIGGGASDGSPPCSAGGGRGMAWGPTPSSPSWARLSKGKCRKIEEKKKKKVRKRDKKHKGKFPKSQKSDEEERRKGKKKKVKSFF